MAGETGKHDYAEGSGKAESDRNFRKSIQNLLYLINDFYGSDNTVVYWFNGSRNRFKLLTAEEDPKNDLYKERFGVGNDYLSTVCLYRKAGIVKLDDDKQNVLVNHFKGPHNIRSLMAAPLLIDDQVIAVVVCESKTGEFFDAPNLEALGIYTESILSYIRYYILEEDYEFENGILGYLFSVSPKDRNEICSLVEKVFSRYIGYQSFYVLTKQDGRYIVAKSFPVDAIGTGTLVENGTLAEKALTGRKIIVHKASPQHKNVLRFSSSEPVLESSVFCCIPFFLEEESIGLVGFDTNADVSTLQKQISRASKLVFPLFLCLNGMYQAHAGTFDGETGLFSKGYFDARLSAEISRCRIFNLNNLFCILIEVDKAGILDESGGKLAVLITEAIKDNLPGYDMIFRVDDYKYAVIVPADSDEKVYLEMEKIRKSISAKIYSIEGKEFTFTVSIAIKRYEDLEQTQSRFLEEINALLSLSFSEGGNLVKI